VVPRRSERYPEPVATQSESKTQARNKGGDLMKLLNPELEKLEQRVAPDLGIGIGIGVGVGLGGNSSDDTNSGSGS